MRKISNNKMEEYMLNHIDDNNLIECHKVYRYLHMMKVMREAEKEIKNKGVIVEICNGSQVFYKENPAIKVWSNMETAMRLLLDVIEFKGTEEEQLEVKQSIKASAQQHKIVELKKGLL